MWSHEALMIWLKEKEELWLLCIQEPYFSAKGVTKLPQQYGAYWKEDETLGHGKKPRALIIAPRLLNGYMVTQLSSRDMVVVKFDKLDIYAISIYCASDIEIEDGINMLTHDLIKGKRQVCCLDTNAYHPRWGSNLKKNRKSSGKKRGETLIKFIDENDLFICNQIPHLATFVRDSVIKDESHIDVTMCTRNMFNDIKNWAVEDETFLSDHRIITFSVGRGLGNPMIRQEEKEINRSLVDNQEIGIPWKKPCKKMNDIMQSALMCNINVNFRLNTCNDVDESIKVHVGKVQQILQKIFRKKHRQQNEVYWWTKEVAIVYQKLRLARRRMRRYGYENQKREFVQCREIFREAVQKAKMVAWKNFMSEVSDPWNKLIKIVKATSVGRILSRTLHDINGVYATSMQETLMFLGKQFFPEPEKKTLMHIRIEKEVEQKLSSYAKGPAITLQELRIAVKELTSSTAPGFDKITNNVLKYLTKNKRTELFYLKLYNFCLSNAYFPAEWKKAKVVLIPKLTSETNSTKAFRPISLTSSLAKLFERIILARILHYLSLSNMLSNNQHAYRKGKSTQTALYELFDVVQYALHRRGGEKSVCVVLFLDISGAFDKTWHHGILHKLLQYNVPEYLVAWLKSFLTDRKGFFMDSDVTHEVNLMQGCPQGGVLSPILWNVLFNEMLSLPAYNGNKRQNRLKIIGYADDAAIVCKAASVEEASHLINIHLQKIYDWSQKYRVKFNTSKLAALTISNRLQKLPPTSIYYNKILVKEVTEYKYLGLIVDSKCTWKSQIKSVLNKLSLVTRSLRGLAGSNWGINLAIFRTLFHAIFIPVMTYGISIWGWRAVHKNMCAKFDQQIRSFGLMATRCMKSTSNVFIFNLLNTQPFVKILQSETLKTSVLQFQILDTARKGVYETYASKRTCRIVPQCIDHFYFMCREKIGGIFNNTSKIEFNDVNSQFLVHPSEWIATETRVDSSCTAIWKGADSRGWVLYTDASKSTHGIGWGLVVLCDNFCVHRSSGALGKCTIFEAEAYALLQAVLYVHTINVNKYEEVEIRTDALALVQALTKQHQTDPILSRIKEELRQAGKAIRIIIRWVPSHTDIYGNCVADKLAKKATDNRNQILMPISNREIKHFMRKQVRTSREEDWENFSSKNVKLFLPNFNSLTIFLKSNPSVPLCQIVSGHTRLNDFVYGKLGLIKSPKCKCNEENETIAHFLFKCTLYAELRNKIWPDFEASYAFITKDWKLLETFIQKTERFKYSVRDELLNRNS